MGYTRVSNSEPVCFSHGAWLPSQFTGIIYLEEYAVFMLVAGHKATLCTSWYMKHIKMRHWGTSKRKDKGGSLSDSSLKWRPPVKTNRVKTESLFARLQRSTSLFLLNCSHSWRTDNFESHEFSLIAELHKFHTFRTVTMTF